MHDKFIGDDINLASRLESACKEYAVRILISENTYQKLRGTYRAREVDRVVVKGKTEPASVFEILDYHTEETFPNLHECLETFKAFVEVWEGFLGMVIENFKIPKRVRSCLSPQRGPPRGRDTF